MLSIITPTLNSEAFLGKLLASTNNLRIPFEHILVDGGSTDSTCEMIPKKNNVRLIHQTLGKGMYGAIQEGFAAARGSLLTWINSDDWIIAEGYTSMYHALMRSNNDFAYSSGYIHKSHASTYTLFPAHRCGKLLLSNGVLPALQPATMYRKSIVILAGGLRYEDFKIAGDIDFFTRIAQHSKTPFCRITSAGAVFLQHGNSLGDRNRHVYLKEMQFVTKPTNGRLGHLIARTFRAIASRYPRVKVKAC